MTLGSGFDFFRRWAQSAPVASEVIGVASGVIPERFGWMDEKGTPKS